ncbi:transporter substrate-binding domain-containing protein [Aliiglaciecola sp. CAU 1673]|uniref:substrate-binding periplasmic protein n=1 Tax=Aliiglaciecola sp. CAU 1673 TaxID=3032595 RepID=UPI0023DBFAD3|nr:transporter substrate-binding domain-containing protein [Aliiglaciecola sp. CAU 1673]MDF2179897.1 transporter substrate-binding domain-containing protein [Aliiglaciecola sp. CAU 1673]
MRLFLLVILILGGKAVANTGCDNSLNPSSQLTPFQLVTEVWPPYQRLDKDGQIRGVAADQIRQVFAILGLKFRPAIMPWARAYQTALETPNTLIFSISRTDEREDSFHWIHKVGSERVYLLALAERREIVLKSESDIALHTLILKRNEASNQYFLDLGMVEGVNILYVNDSAQALNMLLKKRGDIYPITGSGFIATLESTDLSASSFDFRKEMENLHVDLYLAASAHTDPDLLAELSHAFRCTFHLPPL